jgi:hypothetical protein
MYMIEAIGKERDVLGQDLGGVLGPDHTGFEHREAGGHPHDQGAGDQKVKGIERIAQLNRCFH